MHVCFFMPPDRPLGYYECWQAEFFAYPTWFFCESMHTLPRSGHQIFREIGSMVESRGFHSIPFQVFPLELEFMYDVNYVKVHPHT